MSITTNCVINQVIWFECPKWENHVLVDFCHLSPVLFYIWNTNIDDSFHFFRVFFLGIISWKGATLFNGGGGCFSDRALLLSGGLLHWGHQFWFGSGGGGGGSKKNRTMGRGVDTPHTPNTMGKPGPLPVSINF